MTKVFNQKLLQKQSVLQKLLKKQPTGNFLIEINNLLASKSISEITKLEITQIASRYTKNVAKNNLDKLYNLYSDYFIFCLKDKSLSQEEIKNLKHLKEILDLKESQVDKIHNQIAGAIFKKNVRELISDGSITREGEEFLINLQKNLLLSDDFAKEIIKNVKGSFIQEFLDKIISDGRLSPEKENRFLQICKNLNIEAAFSEKDKMLLEKYRLYWILENEEIPTIAVPISLTKQEKCHFQTHVVWYEKRTVTQRINYRGPTVSIKIMKGLRYRAGSFQPQRITSEEWKMIDNATLYLTNRRLIIVGANKSNNIIFSKILSFTPYSDGIEISKDSGRPLLLKFAHDIDIFSIILSRFLND